MPLYEKPADRRKETLVVNKLLRAWPGFLISGRLGEHLAFDRLLYHRWGMPTAWIEIKVRKNEMRRYEDYSISLKKVKAARKWHRLTPGMEKRLVVQWTDHLGWLDLIETPFTKRWGGRTDRHDNFDQETMAHFTFDKFTMIE